MSGFIGPYLTGLIETATGSFTNALLMIAATMCAGIAVLLTVGKRAEAIGSEAYPKVGSVAKPEELVRESD
jgi:cyanate permease